MILESYILEHQLSEEVAERLFIIRGTLKNVLPEATETINWGMPTFKGKKDIIHYAAFKNHIGIFPGPEAIIHFEDRLNEYQTRKGTIQIQHNQIIPVDLIREIAVWCLEYQNGKGS